MQLLDKEIYEEVVKMKEEKLLEKKFKIKFITKVKKFIFEFLETTINKFQFQSTLLLLNFFNKNNRKYIRNENKIAINYLMFDNNQQLLLNINNLEKSNTIFLKILNEELKKLEKGETNINFNEILKLTKIERINSFNESNNIENLNEFENIYENIDIKSIEQTKLYNIHSENEIGNNMIYLNLI